MSILILLVILVAPYLLTKMFAAQHDRTSNPDRPAQFWALSRRPARTEPGSQDEVAWSALDDRQLTRLLTNSAPPTSSE